ncbi:MAG: glycoside hydrolase family 28 protein [Acidobacteriota bacterium]|nr:glycoside hydrolase family 28 protein [Acidobacteriota bacterium]
MLLAVLAPTPMLHAAARSVIDAKSYGAQADGRAKDTAALQRAIDDCARLHCRAVLLPPGVYLSGPLELRSHVHLQLQAGATLLGSPDRQDYPVRADAPWRRVALLHADHAEDIAIEGAGTIDGQGQGWWQRQLQRVRGTPEDKRPMLVDLTHCRRIRIEGVQLINSPQYNIFAVLCDGLIVRRVTIRNPGRGAPNTDGIDPLSTSHVLLEQDTIDTGDDNVAIKSGLVERNDPNVPSRFITIRNCHLRNGHGLSIGSETAGGVQHVRVENVDFDGTRQGIRIKSARGRGNDIGDFRYRHITMHHVETPVQITMYYTGYTGQEVAMPVTEHTPRFHSIRIEDLQADGATNAVQAMGLPESPITGLVLRHVHIAAQHGMVARYVHATMDDVVIDATDQKPLVEGPGVTLERR